MGIGIGIGTNWGKVSLGGGAAPNLAFEFTVQTDNAGTSAADQFTIPITSATPYNISTSDGQSITGATGATTITFPAPGTYTVSITDSCEGWRFANGGDKLKLLNISNWGVYANTTSSSFHGASNMTCSATDIPTGTHTNLASAFRSCTNFNGAIGNWDVSTVVGSASYCFNGCSSFNQPLNNWNTSGITNMTSMFGGNASFNQDLYNWDTSNVTTFNYMFYNATSFNGDIGAWNVGNCTNFGGMFRNTVFNNGGNSNINNWNTSNAITFFEMFFQCSEFNQPIGNWDVSNVTDFRNALSCEFTAAGAFNQDVSSWTPTSATTFQNLFNNQQSFNSNLNSWVFPSATNINSMFQNCFAFNGDITSWNTSNVTDMTELFYNCTIFNQDISSWDVSNVTTFLRMFGNAETFNQNISTWTINTTSPVDMAAMFSGANSFNIDISGWNVSQVTSMSEMFRRTNVFNNGGSSSINNWNTGNVTNMRSMFYEADAFNQPIGNWDTSSVTNMSQMFYNNQAFDQPIGAWDTSSVTNMSSMFYITIIDQDLSNWNIGSITPSTANFNWNKIANFGVPFSTANYDAMLVAYEAQAPPINLTWNIGDATYTLGGAAEAARTSLINTYGWTITDGGGVAETPFIMNVRSNNGTLSYIVTTNPSYTYDYNISTSDGQSFSNLTGDKEIFFPAANTDYDVEITGTFPGLYVNNVTLAERINEIKQWGSQVWRTFDSAFYGCSFLANVTATDDPNTNLVESMLRAFYNCGAIAGIDFSTWNTGNVTNFQETFRGTQGTSWHGQLVNWDTSKATTMFRMFLNLAYNQDLSNWDVSSVTNFSQMFSNNNVIDQSFAAWNIGQATLLSTAFTNFISTGTLSTANYDATLISWAAQAPTSNVSATFGGSQYTLGGAAEAARNTLTTTYGWTITDGGGV